MQQSSLTVRDRTPQAPVIPAIIVEAKAAGLTVEVISAQGKQWRITRRDGVQFFFWAGNERWTSAKQSLGLRGETIDGLRRWLRLQPESDMMGADITHERSTDRQRRAYEWALATYGERAKARRYQAFRFLEEALELAQNQGLSFDDMTRVARYVSDRKVGDTKVEIGDTALCLDILAENLGLSVDTCLTSTLARIKGLDVAACRAKDDAKIAYGLI